MKKMTCMVSLFILGIVVQVFPNASSHFNSNLETTKVTTVNTEEKQALIDLYNATGGDDWIDNTNWLSDEPVSEWYGISVEGDHVVRISLSGNNLIGTVPESFQDLDYVQT